MNKRKSLFRWWLFPALSVCLVLCQACQSPTEKRAVKESHSVHVQPLRYAKLFSMKKHDGYTRIEVFSSSHEKRTPAMRYLLVPRGAAIPRHDSDERVVRVPLGNVTCESGFQVALLELIGASDAIAGVSGEVRVGQDWIHRKIDDGSIAVTGLMRSMNMEKLVSVNPDMVFINTSAAGSDIPAKLGSYGLLPGLFSASLEDHPLGALEWIRFMGAFFGRDSLAAAIFSEKERAYLQVQEKARGLHERPTVIAGYMRKGTWSTMGSSNWFVAMLDHAGADYLFRDQELDRGHMLSGEVAMEKGAEADFWLNTHSRVSTMPELLSEDLRYQAFRSVREGRVYNNNNRCFSNGRSSFWDAGMTEPHLILADLITIFHPELMPGHKLYYYRKLE